LIRDLYAVFVWEKEITIVRVAILPMASVNRKEKKMSITMKSRVKSPVLKRQIVTELFVQSKYAVLAFVSLWLSARLGSIQFIALAVIFGLKWAFNSPKQTIQIFIEERG